MLAQHETAFAKELSIEQLRWFARHTGTEAGKTIAQMNKQELVLTLSEAVNADLLPMESLSEVSAYIRLHMPEKRKVPTNPPVWDSANPVVKIEFPEDDEIIIEDDETVEIEEEAQETPAPVAEKKPKKKQSDDLAAILAQHLNGLVKPALDADAINAIVEKKVAELAKTLGGKTQSFTIKHPKNVEMKRVKGRPHKAFKTVLETLAFEENVFLHGPTGTGKTTLAMQLAKALGLRFYAYPCSDETSAIDFFGYRDANGQFHSTPFIDLYENGGLILLDEFDALDASVGVSLNMPIENGQMGVPQRIENPTAVRHENTIILVSCNTLGDGSSKYTGRNVMDLAVKDRFSLGIHKVDYDKELELELIGAENAIYATRLWDTREMIDQLGIRMSLSTRVFGKIGRRLAAGKSFSYCAKIWLESVEDAETRKKFAKILNGKA